VVWELKRRGHSVVVFEPEQGWSLTHLLEEFGPQALDDFYRAYPGLDSIRYDPATVNLERLLGGVDLVIVHEWNDHDLVRRIGVHHKSGGRYLLLFHDTHHRSVTQPEAMEAYDLSGYDAVLAYGKAIADIYLARGWAQRVRVWHEAADTRVFRPIANGKKEGDLVWIGNWGDEERTRELHEFLIAPVKALRLKARVYGVRYPREALAALADAGIEYGGWLPNFRVPEMFSRFRVTVHVHRQPYAASLPGIPTIRPFEALACRIPLVCSPWEDREGLFTPWRDYFIAGDGEEMKAHLSSILRSPERAAALAVHGRDTILERHTCAHRVDELLKIYEELGARHLMTAEAAAPGSATL
jgi:spore maturation protein CgeB